MTDECTCEYPGSVDRCRCTARHDSPCDWCDWLWDHNCPNQEDTDA